MTMAQIKERFASRFSPDEVSQRTPIHTHIAHAAIQHASSCCFGVGQHRLCFADGRVGDDTMAIGAYRMDGSPTLYLRHKQQCVPHNVEPDDVRKPNTTTWYNTGQQSPAPPQRQAAKGKKHKQPDAQAAADAQSLSSLQSFTCTGTTAAAGTGTGTNAEVDATFTPDAYPKSADKPVLDVEEGTDSKTRMTKLKAFLAHFMRRRPNADDLLRAKIIEENPAVPLVQPTLAAVRLCCDWLAANALDAEGLFRVSAARGENEAVAESLVTGQTLFDKDPGAGGVPPNVHSVATGLKIYLRERTYPLVPYNYYKNYQALVARSDGSEEATMAILQNLVSALPANNQMIVLYLFKFLHKLADHEDKNKMNARNLGVVFGPVIVRTTVNGMQSLEECQAQNTLAQNLVYYSDRFSFGKQATASDMARSLCGQHSQHQHQPPSKHKIVLIPIQQAQQEAKAAQAAKASAAAAMQQPPPPFHSLPTVPAAAATAQLAPLPVMPAPSPPAQKRTPEQEGAPALAPPPEQMAPMLHYNVPPSPTVLRQLPVLTLASMPNKDVNSTLPKVEHQEQRPREQAVPWLLTGKTEEWAVKALKSSPPGTFTVVFVTLQRHVNCLV